MSNEPNTCDSCGAAIEVAGQCPHCDSETIASSQSGANEAAFQRSFPSTLGHYRILGKIGSGGMGVVYKAHDPKLDRTVALKVLPMGPHSTAEANARFQQEIKTVARLSHPNIVAAFHSDDDGGVHFLVMEFIQGDDLSKVVKQEGAFAEEHAIAVICQVAQGLKYAHQQGVIHRDIKPHNLLRSADGTIKILDLGLARVEGLDSSLTGSGTTLGTADYMAPEQAGNPRGSDQRADIYSLGATLFFLLNGRPMYPTENLYQKLKAHAESPIPDLGSRVSPNLKRIFRIMVAKNREARFGSADELLSALQRMDAVSDDGNPKRRLMIVGLVVLAITSVTLAIKRPWQTASLPDVAVPQQDEPLEALSPADAKLPTFPVLDPAQHGLEMHGTEWQLSNVIELEPRVTAIAHHPLTGGLYFAREHINVDDQRVDGGVWRISADGSAEEILREQVFGFAFNPRNQRMFYFRSFRGTVVEHDLAEKQEIRRLDISPIDDDATSPMFPPIGFQGFPVESGEFMFADFGNRGAGGIWKYGSAMEKPQQVIGDVDGRKQKFTALAFGNHTLFAIRHDGIRNEPPSTLVRIKGTRIETVFPTSEPLPMIGSMVNDSRHGALLVNEFKGGRVLTVELSNPPQPSQVRPLITGFAQVTFNALSLSPDGHRFAVVDDASQRIYEFRR